MVNASGNILFVGSIGLENNETVFRSLAESVGGAAKRYPDGETGDRTHWIRWQQRNLEESPAFEIDDGDAKLAGFKDTAKRTVYRIANDTSEISFDNIGYADQALQSWSVFRQMKDSGVIAKDVRFQVSLPTPSAFLNCFLIYDDRAKVEAPYKEAIARETARIVDGIPAEELAIQWDVCSEIVAHDGGSRLHYDDAYEGSITRVTELGALVPEPVQLGYHLCYGDPGHKHIVEPENLETSVKFSNAICAHARRPVNWVHMPVPRGRNDADYFTALQKLDVHPETEIYLGLIHYTDGVAGTDERIRAARQFNSEFGLATECGFGRRSAETIPELLRIHSECAKI